ncbi:hypothetical protein D3C75_970130 [compost metagenome]
MHVHLLQRLHGLRDGAEDRDADVLDEHFLRRGGTALHAVEDDHVGAGLHRQLDVVVRAAGADLHVDRFFPVGDLADLGNLDRQVIRAGPVRVAAGAALVDADRQGTHAGDALGDLHAQQHAAAARLGALAEDDLDGVGLAQVVRVHAVARRQVLIDQVLRLPALLRGHAAVTGGGAGTGDGRAAAQGFLGIGR